MIPEVEAVHVCSIHKVHAEQVVAAARAGKHVLVEKPMALSVAECDRMIAACEDVPGVVLMVGQVMRHFPVNLRVRSLIQEGAIGEVGHMIRRRYGNFDPPDRSWYLDLELVVVFAFCIVLVRTNTIFYPGISIPPL